MGQRFTPQFTGKKIRSRTGSEVIFKGLRLNAEEITWTEGVGMWVEEAQKTNLKFAASAYPDDSQARI
jgi:hypothetical protein